MSAIRFLRGWVVVALITFAVSPAAGVEWISRADLSLEANKQLVEELPAKGFVPIYSKVTVFSDNTLKIDVVYLKPLDVAWEYRLYDDAEYPEKNRKLLDQGYKQVSHQKYEVDGKTYHNCIWHKAE